MDELLQGSLQDALRMLAERSLFAQMRKQAASEQATAAQNARQQLGVLGVDEKVINDAIGRLRQGRLSPDSAGRKIRSAVPGVSEQVGNLPAAVGRSVQQGRPSDAAAQADVLGLKALSPWSEHFNPLSALDSLAAGGGAAFLQNKMQSNRRLWQLLHGADEDAIAAMKSTLPEGVGDRWDRWRRQAAKTEPGILQRLGLQAPPKNTVVATKKMPVNAQGATAHGPPKPAAITRGHLENARQWKPKGKPVGKPTAASLAGAAGQLAAPVLAGLAPLAFHEWLGPQGYRSGRKPIRELVDASKPQEAKK